MYRPGKMGIAEGLSLVFIITFVPVFLSIWSITTDRSQSAAWAVPVINGIITMLALCGLMWAMKRYSMDLLDLSEYLFGKIGKWLIGSTYILLFFMEAVFLLREFAENTLLTALPAAEFSLIIVFFTILMLILVFMGIESVARTAYILLPFVALSILIVAVLLRPKFIFYQLAPWQGPGITSLLLSGAKVSGFNFGLFLIPLLGYSFQTISTICRACIYGFGISIFLRILMVLSYSLTFGSTVGREKVLPFFEMTRLAYLSRYVQRIDALFILIWVMAGVMAIAVNFYAAHFIVARLFKLPDLRPLFILGALILAQLAMLPDDITTVIILHAQIMMTVNNIGSLIIPFLIILAALLKGEKPRQCANESQ